VSTPDAEAAAGAVAPKDADAALPRSVAAELPPQRYIVVEGPIGVGKTTLARRLGETLEAELVLEQDAHNPFLERFYRNPRSGALPAQLFFLFQRAQQMSSLQQQDLFAPRRVADYLFEKDRLFASLTLDSAEMGLYEQVASRLAVDPPRPDLVVYLQAPVETLLQRIARRGIGYETSGIDAAYLSRLNDAYARFFHEYDRAPLLIVNASNIDPVQNQADFDELVGAIRRMKKGRMYYNPLRHSTI
jgi:deoxyadenosine/deoxycytidine kinase